MDFLKELNEIQLEAVKQIEGPVMIMAGPGSGKTRVLTYRIAYMMECGIDPFRILALTFTNKAAAEMRHRIQEIIGLEAKNLWMGTFHSIFARILRYDGDKLGYPSNFTIYDVQDAKSLLKQIIKEEGLNDKLYKPNTVYFRISSAKNSLLSPAAYQADTNLVSDDESSGRPKIGYLYEKYAKRCFQAGAMDFDDLLLKMYELLDKHPEVLYKYQNKFQFLMVDEFQDTNYAQYEIIKKLAAIHENIGVVGDDAQSIYAFRGATIENILSFQKEYPDTKVLKLEQNYRSTEHIVNAANEIIQNNKSQLAKTIWTDKGEGEKIQVFKCMTDSDEGRAVADNIHEQKLRYHYKNNDIAILYRTNAQSRSFEESLRKHNIPYKVYGGMSFYQRKEIKDIIGYFRLTVNHADEEALRRVINYPTRGIGKTTVEKAMVIANQQEKTLWQVLANIGMYNFNSRQKTLINQFVIMVKSFATMLETQNAYDVAFHIGKSTGLLRELHGDKSIEGLARFENIQELLNGIKEFSERDVVEEEGEETQDQDRSLGAYLQDISLLTNQDDDDNENDSVKLMTVHAAKGLEFACVYVVGMEDQLFPSMMSMNSREDLEEERRLFYVAVTRAKEKLTLAFALSRYRFGQLQYCEPSRFLKEIDQNRLEVKGNVTKPRSEILGGGLKRKSGGLLKKKPDYEHHISEDFTADDPQNVQVGMEVEHNRFGVGKVQSLEGVGQNKIATVHFDAAGQKKIMLKFAKLMILRNNNMDD